MDIDIVKGMNSMEGAELILPTHYVDMEAADLEYRAGFSLGGDVMSILSTIGGAVAAIAMMVGGLAEVTATPSEP